MNAGARGSPVPATLSVSAPERSGGSGLDDRAATSGPTSGLASLWRYLRVSRLVRRKLEAGRERRLIQTVHGVGYALREP